MADASKAVMQGIGFEVPQAAPWLAQATYTELNPRPGLAVAPVGSEASDLVVYTHGNTQDADVLTYCVRPGLAHAARHAWEAETDTRKIGWEVPHAQMDWELIEKADQATGALLPGAEVTRLVRNPDVTCILTSGVVVVVYERVIQTGTIHVVNGTLRRELVVRTRPRDSLTWSAAVVVDSRAYDSTKPYHPGICVHGPDLDQVLVFGWSFLDPDGDGTDEDANIGVWLSRDQGVTFTQVNEAAAAEDISLTATLAPDSFRRIRAASNGRDVLVWAAWRQPAPASATAEETRDILTQWASNDGGVSLLQVAQTTVTSLDQGGRFPDVTALPAGSGARGAFLVSYMVNSAGTDRKWVSYVIGSAFQPWYTGDAGTGNTPDTMEVSRQTSTTVSGFDINTLDQTGGLATVLADDGTVYAYFLHVDTAGSVWSGLARRTEDYLTWSRQGYSDPVARGGVDYRDGAAWWNMAPSKTCYPARYGATWAGEGRVALVHCTEPDGSLTAGTNWPASPAAPTSNAFDRIGLSWLGGYTPHELPAFNGRREEDAQCSWERTWIPADLPSVTSYTFTDTAVVTPTVHDPTGTIINTTGSEAVYGSLALGTPAQRYGATHENTAHLVSAATGTLLIGIDMRISNGSSWGYHVQIRLTATGYEVHDLHAGTTLLSTETAPSATGMVIRLCVQGIVGVLGWQGQLRVEHRPNDGASIRRWTLAYSTSTLVDDSGAGGTSNIDYGHLSGTGDGQSTWARHADSWGPWAGLKHASQSSPGDLLGRRYGQLPVELDGGLSVSARRGPALPGDQHDIDALADYRVLRAMENESPRDEWRGVAWTAGSPVAAIPFVWALDGASGAEDTEGFSDLLAIPIFGANWKDMTIEGRASSSWSSLGSIDLAAQLGMSSASFTRHGNMVVPQAELSGSPWLYENECAGWTVILVPDAGDTVYRRVHTNTAGKWVTGAQGLRLQLEDQLPTDPTSGTMHLVPSSCVVLLRMNAARYSGLRVNISAQETVDGYLRCGLAKLLAVRATTCIDFGWSTLWDPAGTKVDRTPDRRRQVRDGLKVTGPLQGRGVERVWGWNYGGAGGAGHMTTWLTTPDYLLADTRGGSLAVGTRDHAQLMQAIVAHTRGSVAPVLALRHLPQGNTTLEVLTRRRQWLWGALTAGVQLDNTITVGDLEPTVEGTQEVTRVTDLTVREIP